MRQANWLAAILCAVLATGAAPAVTRAAQAERVPAGTLADGTAVEPQKFPDAPNHANFVSARIDPGRACRHAMVYRLSCRTVR